MGIPETLSTPSFWSRSRRGRRKLGPSPVALLALAVLALLGTALWQLAESGQRAANAALWQAFSASDIAKAREALRAGADPNCRKRFFPRPFLRSVKLWFEAIHPLDQKRAKHARKLLRFRGTTILFAAVAAKQTAMVGLLLNAGADPEGENYNDERPLHRAVFDPRDEDGSSQAILRLLLAAGANPNARRTDGATPLIVAAYSGVGAERIKLLREAGADPALTMETGATAADFISPSTPPEVARLLQTGQPSSGISSP